MKKVMVVGAGPAGMKAAEVAARRGHQVVIYEKENYLGGQVKLASIAPLRQEFGEVARYLETQVKKLGVRIRLSQEANEECVNAELPDAVVVATGCETVRTLFLNDSFTETRILGIDQQDVISVWDVLKAKEKVGERVMIIDGDAHPRNLVIADYLADEKNRKVEIVTSARNILPERIHPWESSALSRRLREKGIIMYLSTRIKEISGSRVTLVSSSSSKETVMEGVQTIVWAAGARANDRLYFSLKGRVKELYRVGDCVAPRWVDFAIWEGEKVGRTL